MWNFKTQTKLFCKKKKEKQDLTISAPNFTESYIVFLKAFLTPPPQINKTKRNDPPPLKKKKKQTELILVRNVSSWQTRLKTYKYLLCFLSVFQSHSKAVSSALLWCPLWYWEVTGCELGAWAQTHVHAWKWEMIICTVFCKIHKF